ncbi:hypothetical protein D5S18_23145 [Nocardia panacis]|uniref:Uncharacterized protein n=1 Tax=Nocardia panacis TaxID=2340916 RepID=A0A3A4KAI6_9NOCA|nr:hypothetical protein D5S18_23145 [Nocardia panacis]
MDSKSDHWTRRDQGADSARRTTGQGSDSVQRVLDADSLLKSTTGRDAGLIPKIGLDVDSARIPTRPHWALPVQDAIRIRVPASEHAVGVRNPTGEVVFPASYPGVILVDRQAVYLNRVPLRELDPVPPVQKVDPTRRHPAGSAQ